jgi:hypothetical protein
MEAAQAAGFHQRAVYRARAKLRLAVVQSSYGKDKRSIWTWPDSSNINNESQSCQTKTSVKLDKVVRIATSNAPVRDDDTE